MAFAPSGVGLLRHSRTSRLLTWCSYAAVVSSVFSIVIYYFGRFYSPILFKCYRTLPLNEQREWDVRQVLHVRMHCMGRNRC